ncbi:hypothetical protein KCTC52924_03265 [Arenibacter antarcticus]|uniref:Lipoprotein n=1 Tax=Arenibacter antarcticus TaxID=2040469 RepID=A0ABW5VIV4_9FLAO|nr:hypothetical protein [Arenibacter sp. H213]MCM4166334.1 hypothetical protein [Arenibacter sp. H213]
MKNHYFPDQILNRVKGSFTLLLCIAFLGGCAVNKRSNAINGEEVEIQLLEQEDDSEGILTSILGLVIPQVINWGVSGATTLIDKQAEKYTADYSASISRSDFYVSGVRKNELLQKYKGFEVIRKADIVATNGGSLRSQVSSNFVFHFDLNPEKTFMSLNPKKIVVHYAKAKLNEKDHNLDVLVAISISSTWVDAGKTFNKKEIASLEFRFSDIVINQNYDENSDLIKSQLNNWFPLPPISVDNENNVEDHGYFDIDIKVIETDDFGKRLEKYSTTLKSNSDLINAVLNKLVD